MNLFSPKPRAGAIVLVAGLAQASLAASDPLTQVIKTESAATAAAIASQRKIDKLSDENRRMLDEFRSMSREAETLAVYNSYLKKLIASQQSETESLIDQLSEIETTQREIVPLLLRMLDSLERFVKLDIPFLPEERRKRIEGLKDMMMRADITNAEKFRRIMEAYQVENDYGHTIEAYRADLDLNGAVSDVEFLRLGRLALFYQRLDGSETGAWNRMSKRWEPLPDDYRNPIRNGLRMARKETAPDLLIVPIMAPEESR
ncbi:MAG: DUF3450 domain-containing protein [Pseudomonadota bacterium]